MAGVATPNLPTFFLGTIESAQFPNADLTGGVNRGGGCSPGIGVNTGDYSPKASDWSEEERDPQNSQHIGGTEAELTVDQDPDFNDQAAFVQTSGSVAPGGNLKTGVVNRTGKTVPSGAWCWGTKTVA